MIVVYIKYIKCTLNTLKLHMVALQKSQWMNSELAQITEQEKQPWGDMACESSVSIQNVGFCCIYILLYFYWTVFLVLSLNQELSS